MSEPEVEARSPSEEDDADAEGAAPEPDPVEAAWAEVEARWESAEAHKKFLVLADTMDRLADAGRRYRAVKERGEPEKRAEAEKRIDELFGLAMARVRTDKVEPQKARSRIEWVALGVSLVLLSAALFSMMRLLGE